MTVNEPISSKLLEITNRCIDPLKGKLAVHGIASNQVYLLFVVYKDLKMLEVHVRKREEHTYRKLSAYAITKSSGILGPKLKEGDKQVPEGFYFIDTFNPKSKYHLSLRINYPNAYDQFHQYTGSSIYIHGGNTSEGCIPVGDFAMEELYLLATMAKNNGQEKIPVYIFPFPLSSENLSLHSTDQQLDKVLFWKNLQEGYQQFIDTQKELLIHLNNGKYSINAY